MAGRAGNDGHELSGSWICNGRVVVRVEWGLSKGKRLNACMQGGFVIVPKMTGCGSSPSREAGMGRV